MSDAQILLSSATEVTGEVMTKFPFPLMQLPRIAQVLTGLNSITLLPSHTILEWFLHLKSSGLTHNGGDQDKVSPAEVRDTGGDQLEIPITHEKAQMPREKGIRRRREQLTRVSIIYLYEVPFCR